MRKKKLRKKYFQVCDKATGGVWEEFEDIEDAYFYINEAQAKCQKKATSFYIRKVVRR